MEVEELVVRENFENDGGWIAFHNSVPVFATDCFGNGIYELLESGEPLVQVVPTTRSFESGTYFYNWVFDTLQAPPLSSEEEMDRYFARQHRERYGRPGHPEDAQTSLCME
jgi:hypothetical protein